MAQSLPGQNTSTYERFLTAAGDWLSGLAEHKERLHLLQKLCVFAVAFLVFANGITNGYNVDDIYYTTAEHPISGKGIKAIGEIFTTHTLHDIGNDGYDYRPLPMLTFALQHQFLSPSAFTGHLINVILYAFLCMFIFSLMSKWFGDKRVWVAFFAALLFAVHPLHTEVADNIKNRDELMSTFFCMYMLHYCLKWYTEQKKLHLLWALLFYIAAYLCKATGVIYVAIVPLILYFFTDISLRKIAIPFLLVAACHLLLLFIIGYYLPSPQRKFLFFENPMFVAAIPLEVKTATAAYISGWYTYLHVFPYPLSFYYGYKYVRLLHWTNVMAIASAVLLIALVYIAVKGLKKKSLVSFGAIYYLVMIAIFSNIMQPAPGMMAERFVFDASLGYCILAAAGLMHLFKVPPETFTVSRKTMPFIITFSFVFFSYSVMSMVRNTQWKDSWTLYNHDIKHLQQSVKANLFYGELVLMKAGRYRMAYNTSTGVQQQKYKDSVDMLIEEERAPFLRALEVFPNYNETMNYLALAYLSEDSFATAKKYLLRTRAITPDRVDVRYNLGLVYNILSDETPAYADSAIEEYKAVIKLNPKHDKVYGDLSLAYMKRGDTAAAIENLYMAMKVFPDISAPYMQMAQIYLFKKDTLQAVHYDELGAEVAHPSPALFDILANYYHSKNNTEKENYYRSKIK